MTHSLPLPVLCGQLLVVGFGAGGVPASVLARLRAGERAGIIVFKRNLTDDVLAVAELTREAAAACPVDLPPLIAVDQEGGRVARLRAPVVELPPMNAFGRWGDVALTRRAARVLASQLVALGFTTGFSPVLDVNVNPKNPVIGDRAFGDEPRVVGQMGVAFVEGLREGGLLSCGKHYPGHGDTSKDSHFDLPVVDAARARLAEVELPPFRAAAAAGIDMLMTAHVLYPALDAERPATLSRAIATDLARRELGFSGVLVSDDLEMKALSQNVEDTSIAAIDAGCDMLLVCSDEAMAARAHDALVKRAEQSAAFRARCEEAVERSLAMRRRAPPRPARDRAEIERVVGGDEAKSLAAELARRLA